ncbi:hypothetical protein HXX76_001995 [Chlamydomonas incerta]|uniref:Uncharacterized protein n=1 Tax=Chlamydomonas incerta TaxID=51695 RepID=A0A836B031_CHLIN|nr:hypothetical protein HXX76_001995 [Chlamydomonas incerta]|eukprot:KAG2443646.1 hypothetical protein HXX76_001995 [Chlamydomonas incerta]
MGGFEFADYEFTDWGVALGGSVTACETLLIREAGDSTARLEDIAAEAGHLALLRWLREARRSGALPQPLPPIDWNSDEDGPEELATATAACRGGHAHILAWLQEEDQQPQLQQLRARARQEERDADEGLEIAVPGAGLYAIDPEAVPHLAAAAAAGGRVQLLDQLLPCLEPLPTGAACSVLLSAVHGCPLEAVRRVHRRRYHDGAAILGAGAKQSLAITAAVSGTADWEQKLDWVMANVRQPVPNTPLPGHPHAVWSGAVVEDEDPDVDDEVDEADTDAQVLMGGAGTLPDWLRRLRALQARGVPLPPLSDLAQSAAYAGDVAALSWLLDELGGGGEGGMEGLLRGIQHDTTWIAALSGNLAAADWLSQLLAAHQLKPVVPTASSVAGTVHREEHAFGALRWWLTQRQERGGVLEIKEAEGIEETDRGRYEGQRKHTRTQWDWLVAKRLEAAAQLEAVGQAGAVAAARAEAERVAEVQMARVATSSRRHAPVGPFELAPDHSAEASEEDGSSDGDGELGGGQEE